MTIHQCYSSLQRHIAIMHKQKNKGTLYQVNPAGLRNYLTNLTHTSMDKVVFESETHSLTDWQTSRDHAHQSNKGSSLIRDNLTKNKFQIQKCPHSILAPFNFFLHY